jgi:hypothetical protein
MQDAVNSDVRYFEAIVVGTDYFTMIPRSQSYEVETDLKMWEEQNRRKRNSEHSLCAEENDRLKKLS